MMKAIHIIPTYYKRSTYCFIKQLSKILFFTILLISCSSPDSSNKELENYIKNNYLSPDEYVISKFQNYDYVFLGEQHRIRHDANFVGNLIPKLYENGIRNLAIEFGDASNQLLLDSLICSKEWNQDFAYNIASGGFFITWGYKEYIDILKKAWEQNQLINNSLPKFRIIYLNTDYFPSKKGIARYGGKDPDLNMSNVFEKEVITKKEKALIYTGINHAFTRYHQPIYQSEESETVSLFDKRFGNLIHEKYPNKTFTIFLHAPWQSERKRSSKAVKPVNGVIDACMATLDNQPVGFDVTGTPFGELNSDDSFYLLGH